MRYALDLTQVAPKRVFPLGERFTGIDENPDDARFLRK